MKLFTEESSICDSVCFSWTLVETGHMLPIRMVCSIGEFAHWVKVLSHHCLPCPHKPLIVMCFYRTDSFAFFSFSSAAWFKDSLSVWPSIYPPTDPSVCPSVFLSIHLSVCRSTCPPSYGPTFPSAKTCRLALSCTLNLMTVSLDAASLSRLWKAGLGRVKQVSIVTSLQMQWQGRV